MDYNFLDSDWRATQFFNKRVREEDEDALKHA